MKNIMDFVVFRTWGVRGALQKLQPSYQSTKMLLGTVPPRKMHACFATSACCNPKPLLALSSGTRHRRVGLVRRRVLDDLGCFSVALTPRRDGDRGRGGGELARSVLARTA